MFSVTCVIQLSLAGRSTMRAARNILLVLLMISNCVLVYKNFYLVEKPSFPEMSEKRKNVAPTTKYSLTLYHSDFCECDRQILVTSTSVTNDTLHWCSEESTMRGMNQHVVAYSLFGYAERYGNRTSYFSLLDKIPPQVKRYFSRDWQVRIYHNIKKESSLEHRLLCNAYCLNENVDICNINDVIQSINTVKRVTKKSTPVNYAYVWKLNMRMWRYLAMLDPQVDRFMARDSDSEINERESDAVRHWLESPYTFHVVRDHQGHQAEIMGGIFGVKVHQRRDLVQGLTKAMISHGIRSSDKSLDQNLLASIFWPTVKDDAMIQDSYYCMKDWNSLPATPFRTKRINLTFVTDRTGAEWGRPRKCPLQCRPPDHQDWEYC